MSSFLPSLSPRSILSLIPSFFYALFHHSFHSSFFCLTLSFFPSLTHIPTVIYFIFASIILSFFHSSCPSFHLLFHHVLSVLPCIPHAIHPPYFFHPLINQPFCLSSFVSHFIRLLLHHRSEHRDPRLQQCRGLVLRPECCSAGFGCGVTAKTALSIARSLSHNINSYRLRDSQDKDFTPQMFSSTQPSSPAENARLPLYKCSVNGDDFSDMFTIHMANFTEL